MVFLRFVAISCLAILLAACSSQTSTTTTTTDNISGTPQVINTDPDNAGFVARVNDVAISQETFDSFYARRSVGSNAATNTALAQQVLNELVEQELINQGAPTLGVTITDVDVAAEIAIQREIAGSEDAWLASLAQNNYTQEEWLAAQQNVLVTLGVRNVLIEPYLGEIEQVNARHILVRTEASANEVLDRLEAGEIFEALAAEYSLDNTTTNSGGNLGWFARNELYQPALENRAFELEAGTISYVSTALGYHIVETLGHEVRTVEFERLAVLSENVFSKWLDSQYRNASIDIYIQW